MAKPFVKWAGGKGNLISQLENLLPAGFNEMQDVTYIEPFVGGGAMFFHMIQNHPNIRRAVINDINEDLIHCYRLIKESPQILIDQLRIIEDRFYQVENEERNAVYYEYRNQFNNNDVGPNERAALFMFLNHTCYNGLFRVNSAGRFNVPIGRYKDPQICNEELIMDDHQMLNSIEIVIKEPGDYRLVGRNLSMRGTNFIYFDPPYRPLSVTSYFKEYSNSPFGDRQQEELKAFCDHMTARGAMIMLSNSDSIDEDGNPYFEGLYEGYNFNRVLASRCINANVENRARLLELVIRNYQ